MNDIPEFGYSKTTGKKTMRPKIGGKTLFQRIPICHRQLKHEIVSFADWIERLIRIDKEQKKKNDKHYPFFDREDVGVLIAGIDRGELVYVELGSEEMVNRIREIIQKPIKELINNGESERQTGDYDDWGRVEAAPIGGIKGDPSNKERAGDKSDTLRDRGTGTGSPLRRFPFDNVQANEDGHI